MTPMEVLDGWENGLLISAASIAIIFVGGWVLSFATSPYRLWGESEGIIAEIEEKKNIDEIEKTLAYLLTEGQEFIGKRVPENEYKEWCQKLDEWLQKTFLYIDANVSHGDAALLNAISVVANKRHRYALSVEHNNKLLFQDERIEVLKQIIRNFQKGKG